MPLFLTSLTFGGLAAWLRRHGAAGPVAVITNASRELPDGDVLVGMAEAEMSAQGLSVRRVDVLTDPAQVLEEAATIVLTGGDPFRLLADLRASGADQALRAAHERGVPLAGQSAGAIVCGPTLDPIRLTSPFQPPQGLDLRGLGLTDTVVLPHQDRPGRADAHRQAALAFGETLRLTVLWDDEALMEEDGGWQVDRLGCRTRAATAEDADALAEIFHQASLQAWAPFLGRDRLTAADKDVPGWSRRIAAGGHRMLVTEDDQGPAGFVWYRPASGGTAEAPVGEVDMLYTHPRASGHGIGRRLLERATWHLLCEGFREAVLWSEERNERALALYRHGGWAPDGLVDERSYLGVPIRNLRHRLDLTRLAGGA